MTNPWSIKYLQMITDVARNESEEAALRMLNQGSSFIEAQMKSGLSYEMFRDLMKRADKYESEVLCIRKNRPDIYK